MLLFCCLSFLRCYLSCKSELFARDNVSMTCCMLHSRQLADSAYNRPSLCAQEFQEENRKSLLNLVSDSITASLILIILATASDNRRNLMQTVGRVFGGLSDTAKAFLIIASTDILLGCEWHPPETNLACTIQLMRTSHLMTCISKSECSMTGHCSSTHCKAEVSTWVRRLLSASSSGRGAELQLPF